MEIPKNLASAYDKALDLLARAPQTTFILRIKLQKREFNQSDINKTVILLTEAGLLNDYEFAHDYTKMLINRKMYGPSRIKAKLYEKGLRGTEYDDIIYELIEESGGEESIAARYINKNRIQYNKLKKGSKQKIQQKLYQHGFSYDCIRIVCKRIDDILECE